MNSRGAAAHASDHVMSDPTMTRPDIRALVAERLSAILAIERDRITPGASLAGDLHADSLDLVEAVESIEESLRGQGYDLRVQESAFADWTTVDDIVTTIHRALEERGA